MAKVVIAGKCDCPFFARVELLADKLAIDLPDFTVTKIIKKPDQWEVSYPRSQRFILPQEFTQWIRENHGWVVQSSPIVWRELIDRNGKGTLIGGPNDFEEFAASFYHSFSSMTTNDMVKIAKDNTRFKLAQEQEKTEQLAKIIQPSRVLMIGEPTPTTAFFIAALGRGEIFGPNEYVGVYLYNPETEPNVFKNMTTDISEALLEYLSEFVVANDLHAILPTVKQIIIHNVVPRRECSTGFEERKSWLLRRYEYFRTLGELFRELCAHDVQILVVSNLKAAAQGWDHVEPMNFDITTLYQVMKPRFSTHQIVGLVRPMELKLKSLVAKELKVKTKDITNLVIWGNMYHCMLADMSQSKVYRRKEKDTGIVANSWYSAKVTEVIRNQKLLEEDLFAILGEKYHHTFSHQGLLLGHTMATFLRECWQGKLRSENKISSLVLCSEGWYEVPPGIAFSFPVTAAPKSTWSVLEDMPLTIQQLRELPKCILSVLNDWAVVDPTPLTDFKKPRKESIYKIGGN